MSEKETNLVSAYYVVKMFFQIYFYHNVKCRQEMYDKDILMLQVLCMWLELLRIFMDNFVGVEKIKGDKSSPVFICC